MPRLRLLVPVLIGALFSMLAATLAPAASAPAASAEGTGWLCRPGLVDDPCEIGLDTTYREADGTERVVTPARLPQDERPVDCFYVYPTVTNQLAPNASATADPEIRSIASYQASRYSTQCRVFAPLYRQMSPLGFALGPLGAADVAYGDVSRAWGEFLEEVGPDRGFVLIGHSQGTIMLRRLIADRIDDDPALRDRLVSAVLLGGNVRVAKGATTGGDFDNVPLCTVRGQHGCVVAYSSYVNAPPPLVSFFGNASFDPVSLIGNIRTRGGQQVACTDPALLSGDDSDFGVTVPSEPFAPGAIQGLLTLSVYGQVPTADTTWASPADRFRGGCRTVNGATVLRYDPVGPQSRRPLELPPAWGTHLFDGNLGLEKLVSIVGQQTQAWRSSR